jgi:hypothetical protein
MLTLEL